MPTPRFARDRPDRGCRSGRRAALLLLAAAGAQGCAFTYTDASGHRHTLGLVDISVRAPAAPETLAGDIVDMTSLGLSIGRNAQGGYLTVGYNRQSTAALRDNALVLGNPITALSASHNVGEEPSKCVQQPESPCFRSSRRSEMSGVFGAPVGGVRRVQQNTLRDAHHDREER
jgi:hypothetical protein